MEKPVKTTVKLSRDLWRRVQHRAIDEGCDLQDLIAKALEMYLKIPLKREGK